MQHENRKYFGDQTIKWKGTWRFRIEYDSGVLHMAGIPNTLYFK